MSRLFVPIDNLPFFSLLFQELPAPSAQTNTQRLQALLDANHPVLQDLGDLATAAWSANPHHPQAMLGVTGLNERPTGLVFHGIVTHTHRGMAHAVLYRAPYRWRLALVHEGINSCSSDAVLDGIDRRFVASPNQVLEPCPCCGHRFPAFQRLGTSASASLVACGNCDFSLESKEEAEQNGGQWNRLARVPFSPSTGDATARLAISPVCGTYCQAWAQGAHRLAADALS